MLYDDMYPWLRTCHMLVYSNGYEIICVRYNMWMLCCMWWNDMFTIWYVKIEYVWRCCPWYDMWIWWYMIWYVHYMIWYVRTYVNQSNIYNIKNKNKNKKNKNGRWQDRKLRWTSEFSFAHDPQRAHNVGATTKTKPDLQPPPKTPARKKNSEKKRERQWENRRSSGEAKRYEIDVETSFTQRK